MLPISSRLRRIDFSSILSLYAPLEAAAFAIDLGLRVAWIDGHAIHAIWLAVKGWM
jgi:hypothetical protein